MTSERTPRNIISTSQDVDAFGYWYHEVLFQVENTYEANGRSMRDARVYMAQHPTLLMHCYTAGYSESDTAYEMSRHIIKDPVA